MSPAPVPDAAAQPFWILAAERPAELARFYGALLGGPARRGLAPQHWCVPLPAGGTLEIYRPSRQRPAAPPGGRWALALRRRSGAECRAEPIAELELWLQEACGLGATVLEPARTESFGAEAWIGDPESNRVLLLVMPADPVAVSR